jgi:hypothetical protein
MSTIRQRNDRTALDPAWDGSRIGRAPQSDRRALLAAGDALAAEATRVVVGLTKSPGLPPNPTEVVWILRTAVAAWKRAAG